MKQCTESDDLNEKSLELGGDLLTTFTFEKNREGAKINIAGCTKLLPIPETDGGVRGIIYFHDEIIPVIDLGMKFGEGLTEISDTNSILLLEHERNDKRYNVGVLVSDVSDVYAIIGEKIGDSIKDLTSDCSDVNSCVNKHARLAEALMNFDRITQDIDFDNYVAED